MKRTSDTQKRTVRSVESTVRLCKMTFLQVIEVSPRRRYGRFIHSKTQSYQQGRLVPTPPFQPFPFTLHFSSVRDRRDVASSRRCALSCGGDFPAPRGLRPRSELTHWTGAQDLFRRDAETANRRHAGSRSPTVVMSEPWRWAETTEMQTKDRWATVRPEVRTRRDGAEVTRAEQSAE